MRALYDSVRVLLYNASLCEEKERKSFPPRNPCSRRKRRYPISGLRVFGSSNTCFATRGSLRRGAEVQRGAYVEVHICTEVLSLEERKPHHNSLHMLEYNTHITVQHGRMIDSQRCNNKVGTRTREGGGTGGIHGVSCVCLPCVSPVCVSCVLCGHSSYLCRGRSRADIRLEDRYGT